MRGASPIFHRKRFIHFDESRPDALYMYIGSFTKLNHLALGVWRIYVFICEGFTSLLSDSIFTSSNKY